MTTTAISYGLLGFSIGAVIGYMRGLRTGVRRVLRLARDHALREDAERITP